MIHWLFISNLKNGDFLVQDCFCLFGKPVYIASESNDQNVNYKNSLPMFAFTSENRRNAKFLVCYCHGKRTQNGNSKL